MILLPITQKQFFQLYPPEIRNIYVDDELVCKLGKDIICDQCNRTIEDDRLYLVSLVENPRTIRDISEAICEECARKTDVL